MSEVTLIELKREMTKALADGNEERCRNLKETIEVMMNPRNEH